MDTGRGDILKKLSDLDLLRQRVIDFMIDKKRESATEEVARFFMDNNHIYTTRDDKCSEVWCYIDGIYLPQGKTYIKEFCRKVFGKVYTTTIANLIIDKIETDTYIDQDSFFNHNYVNEVPVMNGILNIDTKELKEFTPEKIFFNKLPVFFEPEMDCPNIKSFIQSVIKKEDIETMQELFGFLLLKDYRYEKAFMFLGSGRNGKGKTLELMKRFIGVENCVNIPIQTLSKESNFETSELFGKMANLGGDLSKTGLKETGNFKSLTGRDIINAPRKFARPIKFENFAKMIFCANELPYTSDITHGFFNRWILIDFPYTFYNEEDLKSVNEKEKEWAKKADATIIDNISSQEELNGLLNWALEGYERLCKNNTFTNSKSTEDIRQTWLRKSNSFLAFGMDNLVEFYEGKIPKPGLRHCYTMYCRKFRISPVSDRDILKILTENYGCWVTRQNINDGEKISWWNGIKFKENSNWCDDNQDNNKNIFDRFFIQDREDKKDRVF